MAGWRQLDTGRRQFLVTEQQDIDDLLPATGLPVNGSCRFTIENRSKVGAAAYLVTAGDVVSGLLPAMNIPAGEWRVTPVYTWAAGHTLDIPQLHGILGADCYVTPEIRGY